MVELNFNKYVEGDTNINENNVKYTCHASIGMGDFIQRFERLWKLLNYSNIKYVPVKNNILSYKINSLHKLILYIN